MCVLSIEWIWVKIYGKREEKTQFLGIFEGLYRYQTEWYRYHKFSVNCFGPVFVFWPYLGHFVFDMSDSSCWLNYTSRRTKHPEIGTFTF